MSEELNRWKQIAVYLASCNGATAIEMPKAWSKRDKERFRSIARKSADYLEGLDHPEKYYPTTPGEQIRAAIERCRKAIENTDLDNPTEQRE